MISLESYLRLISTHPELLGNAENGLLRIITDAGEITTWQKQEKNILIKDRKPVVWADIGIVLDDPYFLVLRDLVEFPGGYQGGYHWLINRAYLEGGGAGVAILCGMNNSLLLLRNFRHATRDWHWEIPRGFGEPGIAAADQARAEVYEEIGGEISELVNLGSFHNNTGIEGHPINLFFARLKSSAVSSSEDHIVSLSWIAIEKFEAMIASSEITDSFTIAAYARAKLKKLI